MATIDGKWHRLAKGKQNKKQAVVRFHELMAAMRTAAGEFQRRVADVCEAFLDYSSRHHAPDTYRSYLWYLQGFCEHSGYLEVGKLKPYHVTRWVDSRSWNETSQYNGRRFVFRAFSWSVEEGILEKNPLLGMKRPKPRPRQRALSDDEYRALVRATDGCFRVFLFALRETGARPKEARELTWKQVRADRWVFWEHKTDESTTKPRVVYLNEPMQKLMQVLRRRSKSMYVFVNSRGVPWTRNSIRLRIQRLKKKLNLADDVCAYLVRHAFGTKAVMNGVDVATVAELMGHSSTDMVNNVYVHLADQESHLQRAVTKATRSKPE